MLSFFYTLLLIILFVIYFMYMLYDELPKNTFIFRFSLEFFKGFYFSTIYFRFPIYINFINFFDSFNFNINFNFNLHSRPNIFICLYFISVFYNFVLFCVLSFIKWVYTMCSIYFFMASSPYWGEELEILRDSFRVSLFIQFILIIPDIVILWYVLAFVWRYFEYTVLVPVNMFYTFICFFCFLFNIVCKTALYLCLFYAPIVYIRLMYYCSAISAHTIFIFYFLLNSIYKVVFYIKYTRIYIIYADTIWFFNILYGNLFYRLKLILWDDSSFFIKIIVCIFFYFTFVALHFLFYLSIFPPVF